jgi:hypothetical protein
VVYEGEPESNAVPPVDAEYQSTVSPLAGVALIVTVPVPHLDAPAATGTAGTALIVAATTLLVAETQAVEVVFAST